MRLRHLVIMLAVCAARLIGAAPVSNAEIVARTVASAEILQVLPTGSMRPTFDETFLLLVTKEPFEELKVGDIIVYKARPEVFGLKGTEEMLVVHRVQRVSSSHSVLMVQGDKNLYPDPLLVNARAYVGTVVGMIKKPRDPSKEDEELK